MNTKLSAQLFNVTAGIVLILSACGGGDSGSKIGGIDGSGAPVTAGTISVGAINGFGSVIVNGVRYNSDKAKILVNDQPASEINLHAGYQVKITGTKNSNGVATADTIEFYPNLLGTLSQIDLAAQQFTVLGQSVQVNSATLFDAAIKPNYLDGLKLGDNLLVSGFANDKGIITATRIELTTVIHHQVMGYVSNLNEANLSFSIKNLSINYSAASLNNFTNNQIASNNLVVVTGTLDSKGVLQAKTLVRINNSLDKTVKTAETEGFVTRYLSATDFDVAGITWATSGQTSFENGTNANLGLGVALSVSGEANSAGQLIAQKIEFKKSPNNEIVGEVTAISTISSTNIATGTLQISGTSIQTNNKTVFEDNGGAELKRFNFGNITIGDFLKVSGYNSQGNFIATKIEREDIQRENDNELKMSGLIISIDTHSFMLYGRSITTNSKTEINSNNGELLTETQFYLQAIGQRAKVEGILKNGIFTALKIELESNKENSLKPK
jgi:hypothetical protein